MFFIFSCTLGAAQKALLSCYDKGSRNRFTTAEAMLQHLAKLYINPNKSRDARHTYQRLYIKTT